MTRLPATPASRTPFPSPEKAAERRAEVVAFEGGMVAFFTDAAELLGVPKSVAAIYGVIFASPVPIGFAEIEERLGLSKGSVSQGLRALREIGAVRVCEAAAPPSDLPAPISGRGGVRRDLYEPDLEMRKLIQRFLQQRIETQLETGKQRLAGLEAGVREFATPERRVLQERLKRLGRWHTRTRRLLPIVRTFLRIGTRAGLGVDF